MEPTNALDQKAEPAAIGGGARGDPALLEEIKSLWQEFSGLAHDRLTLAALESRLAGTSLVTMIAAGVMIAVLLVSAWLGIIDLLFNQATPASGRPINGDQH